MSSFKPPPSVQSMLNDPRFSDLTISCGDREFKAHKVIICPQSDYFMTACSGRFKEAESNTINLQGDDPDIVEKVLAFLYTSDYDDGSPNANGSGPEESAESGKREANTVSAKDAITGVNITDPNLKDESPAATAAQLVNIRVYTLAEKFLILPLKNLAIQKFLARSRHTNISSAMGSILREVYTNTPASDVGIRKLVVHACVDEELSLMSDPEFKETLQDLPDAHIDLLQELLTETKSAKRLVETTVMKLKAENATLTSRVEHLTAENQQLSASTLLSRDIVRYLSKKAGSMKICDHTTTHVESIVVRLGLPHHAAPSERLCTKVGCIYCSQEADLPLE